MISTKNIAALVTGACLLSVGTAEAGLAVKSYLTPEEVGAKQAIKMYGQQPKKPEMTAEILANPDLLNQYKTDFAQFQTQAKPWDIAYLKGYGEKLEKDASCSLVGNYFTAGFCGFIGAGILGFIGNTVSDNLTYKLNQKK